MSQEAPSSFQTVYRLTIMLGTLACGAMASLRYGPDAGRLAEMIDQVASMVIEVPEGVETASAAPLAFAPAAQTAPLITADQSPAAGEPPRFDAAVRPASALTPVARATSDNELEPLERERLTAPLLAAGATRADVTAWGHGDATVFRATASAPAGDVASGLERRFDAVGPTPEAAVTQLVAEIQASVVR